MVNGNTGTVNSRWPLVMNADFNSDQSFKCGLIRTNIETTEQGIGFLFGSESFLFYREVHDLD